MEKETEQYLHTEVKWNIFLIPLPPPINLSDDIFRGQSDSVHSLRKHQQGTSTVKYTTDIIAHILPNTCEDTLPVNL